MQRRRGESFQLFSFRLEELAAGNHAEKVEPSGERLLTSREHGGARARAEMLLWRFPS